MHQTIPALINQYYRDGVAVRHQLHEYPELSEQETETARLVGACLTSHGIPWTECIPHGIMGTITGTAPHASMKRASSPEPAPKTVALRADMDALPITECADVPYRSAIPGVMHACGHDGHTAGLVMAAWALQDMRDQFRGTVRLLFQPAEETIGGAERMIAAGALDGVDGAFGCHLWGSLPEGTVYFKDGPLMASPDEFQATLTGRGGHGAHPHECVDPVVMAAEAVLQFQTVVSRRFSPLVPVVVTVSSIHGGSGAFNVIPDTVELRGTIRTFDPALRDAVPGELERILTGIALGYGGSYAFSHTKLFPPLINNQQMNALGRKAAAQVVGPERIHTLTEPDMGGEDFACIAAAVPACFFYVGIAPDPATPVLHHSPYFAWNDSVLRTSAGCLAQAALTFLDAEP